MCVTDSDNVARGTGIKRPEENERTLKLKSTSVMRLSGWKRAIPLVLTSISPWKSHASPSAFLSCP